MSENILKNRLAQPVPEKCPLSEALVWLINGCLPISPEDYKIIDTPSIEWRGQTISTHVIDNSEGNLYAIDTDGNETIIHQFELLSAENRLLAALKNGDIKVWAEYGDFTVKNPERPDRINYKLTESWDSHFNLHFPSPFGDIKIKEVPTNLWSRELVEWFDNILHSPLSCDQSSQFADVAISTEDLFKKFGTREFLDQVNRGKPFLISTSEAASLMTTGEHNSDNSLFYDQLMQKSAILLRALRNGKLYAEGRHPDGEIKPVDITTWTSKSSILHDMSEHFRQVYVDENEIRALFDIPEIDETTQESIEPPNKRGRPPTVEKELWFKELAVLFLTGKATKDDNVESLSSSLITSLSDNHNKDISLETVRKDWLRPLFKEAKKRNGGK